MVYTALDYSRAYLNAVTGSNLSTPLRYTTRPSKYFVKDGGGYAPTPDTQLPHDQAVKLNDYVQSGAGQSKAGGSLIDYLTPVIAIAAVALAPFTGGTSLGAVGAIVGSGAGTAIGQDVAGPKGAVVGGLVGGLGGGAGVNAATTVSTAASTAAGVSAVDDFGSYGPQLPADVTGPFLPDFSYPGAALPDVPGSVTAPAVPVAPPPAPGTGSYLDWAKAAAPYVSALPKLAGVVQQLTSANPTQSPASIYTGTTDPYLRAAEAQTLSQGDLATLLAQSDRAMISLPSPNLNGAPAAAAHSSSLPLLAGLGLVLLVFIKRRA